MQPQPVSVVLESSVKPSLDCNSPCLVWLKAQGAGTSHPGWKSVQFSYSGVFLHSVSYILHQTKLGLLKEIYVVGPKSWLSMNP